MCNCFVSSMYDTAVELGEPLKFKRHWLGATLYFTVNKYT